MLDSSLTNVSVSIFILNGIPGLEDLHVWISLPLFSIYIITLIANFSVLFIIKTEPSLHKPMYFFLVMLLVTDVVSSTAAVPKMLCIFWFNARTIQFEACLLQMYIIHSVSIMGSTVLLAMAFDRYIAICHPLRYTSILTNSVIVKIGFMVGMSGFLLVSPHLYLVARLQFCKSNIIDHTYCEHMAIAKLACSDTKVNVVYGLLVALLVVGLDSICIALSYFMIVRAVLRLPSKEARHKAFSTCAAHICVILIAYIPALFSFITHRLRTNMAPHTDILVSNLYLVIPPLLNPIVYGMKTQQIHKKVLKMFNKK